MPFSLTGKGVRVALKVTPKAARPGVGGIVVDAAGNRWLDVRVSAPPDKGKANAAVIKLLAKRWRLASTRLHIASGSAARHKQILIDDHTTGLLARLERLEGAHGSN